MCKTVSLPIDKVVHHIVPVCDGVYQSNQMQITVTEKMQHSIKRIQRLRLIRWSTALSH